MNAAGDNQLGGSNPERQLQTGVGELSSEHLGYWLLLSLMIHYGREPGF
jgi:hypothetical protein